MRITDGGGRSHHYRLIRPVIVSSRVACCVTPYCRCLVRMDGLLDVTVEGAKRGQVSVGPPL